MQSATKISAILGERREENSLTVITIRPSKSDLSIDWDELWRFRELLFFLAWRDVMVRYKQTSLGIAWAVLQPLVAMGIFSVVFGRLAGLANVNPGIPYPIYVFAGLLPWLFFSNSVSSSANSLVGNSNLITKVYFPRLFIPLASIGVGLIDLFVSLMILAVLMAYYGVTPSATMLLTPIVLLGIILSSAGVGMLLSALTVTYRDFRYVVPFMLQAWMFASPIVYPISVISERWRWLFELNPLSGLISAFRSCFLASPIVLPQLVQAMGISVILLILGMATFRKLERRFADTI